MQQRTYGALPITMKNPFATNAGHLEMDL